jgi:acyl-coenzyme A synthetase/AMP-(fatty) acid ligase
MDMEKLLFYERFMAENYVSEVATVESAMATHKGAIRLKEASRQALSRSGYLDFVSSVCMSEDNGVDIRHQDLNRNLYDGLKKLAEGHQHVQCRVDSDSMNRIVMEISYQRQAEDEIDSLLAELDGQGKLITVVCSYLLAVCRVICWQSSDNDRALLLNVPLSTNEAAQKKLLESLEQVLDILASQRTDLLFSHMLNVGAETKGQAYMQYLSNRSEYRCEKNYRTVDVKAGYLIYPMSMGEIVSWDSSLLVLDELLLARLWNVLGMLLRPFTLRKQYLAGTYRNVEVEYMVIPGFQGLARQENREKLASDFQQVIDIAEARGTDMLFLSPGMKSTLDRFNIPVPENISSSSLDRYLPVLFRMVLQYLFDHTGLAIRAVHVVDDGDDQAEYCRSYLQENFADILVSRDRDISATADINILMPAYYIESPTVDKLKSGSLCLNLFEGLRAGKTDNKSANDVLFVNGVSFDMDDVRVHSSLSFNGAHGVSLMRSMLLANNTHNRRTDDRSAADFNAEIYDQLQSRHFRIKSLSGPHGAITAYELDKMTMGGNLSVSRLEKINHGNGVGYRRQALATLGEENINLCRYIFSAARSADSRAVIDPNTGVSLNYAELLQRVVACSRKLEASGLLKGDAVALAAVDGVENVVLMLGCLWKGLVFSPISYMVSEENVRRMLDLVTPGLLLCDRSVFGEYPSVMTSYNAEDLEEWMSDLSCFDESSEYGSLTADQATPLPVDHPAVYLFTSGSTGKPKAVAHSHGDFVHCNLNYTPSIIGLQPDECVYTPSRIFFAYGLNGILISLFAGASHVIAAPLVADNSYIKVLQRFDVNVFFTVPTILKLILQDRNPDASGLSLRLCVSAGEALPGTLYHAVHDYFQTDIIDGIGTTEVLSTFISNRAGLSRSGSSGQLVPGFSVKLINQSNEYCKTGEVGVLWIKGNTITRGYFNDQDNYNQTAFIDGWFNTQDLFFADCDGYFYHVGRVGSTVKVNGCWFSPQILEQVLQEHPLVKESAVWFSEDQYGLSRPNALIVLDREVAEPQSLWSELKEHARQRLGKNNYPHFFTAVDALPKTGSGKLMRYVLPDLV